MTVWIDLKTSENELFENNKLWSSVLDLAQYLIFLVNFLFTTNEKRFQNLQIAIWKFKKCAHFTNFFKALELLPFHFIHSQS